MFVFERILDFHVKITKVEEVDEKAVFYVDLPSSAVKVIIDYIYLRPLEVEVFEDAVLLLDAIERRNKSFRNELQQSVLKKLSPESSLRVWKIFNKTEFLEVRFFESPLTKIDISGD